MDIRDDCRWLVVARARMVMRFCPEFSTMKMMAEFYFRFLGPQSSLSSLNPFPSLVRYPGLLLILSVSFPQSFIMSINYLLLKLALSCNQEAYWYRMPDWYSLLCLCHGIILVYLLGNYALWFHCWKRANNKNNNLLNYAYSIGNRQIWACARSFGGSNSYL